MRPGLALFFDRLATVGHAAIPSLSEQQTVGDQLTAEGQEDVVWAKAPGVWDRPLPVVQFMLSLLA